MEGRLLGGGSQLCYRVGPLLHRSETALIHAVRDEFGTPLVLKLYRPQPGQGEDPAVQWQREQQLLRQVQHPHVLGLRQALQIDGLGGLILERAERNLEAWVLQHGPMSEAQVRELARQLLDGLQAIHAAGIVHLDLSPLNVLLRSEPTTLPTAPHWLIGDFGIAVRLADGVLLSPPAADWALLPPELLTPGRYRPTPRCDLYGLGVTLLFAHRAELPLSNALPPQEMARLIQAEALRQQATQLGTPLGRFLALLLHNDPQRRPASALQAWRVLRALS